MVWRSLICIKFPLTPTLFLLDDLTIAVYPGIANYSDQLYLLSFAKTIQKSGIRCVIASLLGAREGEALTSPRVFTLGKYLLNNKDTGL